MEYSKRVKEGRLTEREVTLTLAWKYRRREQMGGWVGDTREKKMHFKGEKWKNIFTQWINLMVRQPCCLYLIIHAAIKWLSQGPLVYAIRSSLNMKWNPKERKKRISPVCGLYLKQFSIQNLYIEIKDLSIFAEFNFIKVCLFDF